METLFVHFPLIIHTLSIQSIALCTYVKTVRKNDVRHTRFHHSSSIVLAIRLICAILIREYSYHTHTWNGSKYDWNPFVYIYIYYFLCQKGDIIYRYVSLHLKIWDFLTLVILRNSIFMENRKKSIIHGPFVQATWKPHQKMPTWLSCIWCQIRCLQCVKRMDIPFPWSSFSFGMHMLPHYNSFLCFSFHLCAYQCLRVYASPNGTNPSKRERSTMRVSSPWPSARQGLSPSPSLIIPLLESKGTSRFGGISGAITKLLRHKDGMMIG